MLRRARDARGDTCQCSGEHVTHVTHPVAPRVPHPPLVTGVLPRAPLRLRPPPSRMLPCAPACLSRRPSRWELIVTCIVHLPPTLSGTNEPIPNVCKQRLTRTHAQRERSRCVIYVKSRVKPYASQDGTRYQSVSTSAPRKLYCVRSPHSSHGPNARPADLMTNRRR